MAILMQINGKHQIKEKTIGSELIEDGFLDGVNLNLNVNSVNPGTLTGIPDPVNPTDVVNLRTLANQIGGANQIGTSEDGTYTDGLFTDFISSTPIGTAVDRFNEVLKALSPSPAPNLTTVSSGTTGVSGNLSFGSSSSIGGYVNHPTLDIGAAYTVSGTRRGIFNAASTITGTLASNVTPSYTNSRPYPNLSFGNADQGTLKLVVNGTIVHTVDLSTFASGNSVNAQGSGFTSVSAATAVQFDNGNQLALFKYRTGSFTVAAANMRNGYNEVKVQHVIASTTYETNIVEWIVDADVTATTYSGEALNTLTMAGSKYISGVRYHTSGTASFSVNIANPYRNTYSSSASAISYIGVNCTATSSALSTPANNAAGVTISAKTVTLSAVRFLNDSFNIKASTLRTLQGTVSSVNPSISGILMDPVTDDATSTTETFNGEGFRIHNGLSLTNVNYGSGTAGSSQYTWDGTQHLLTGNANHNDGLLVSGGFLSYPKVTTHLTNILNGNFSAPVNGYSGNPDYSAASGNRTFYRYFYTSSAKSNFNLAVTATSTTFVSVATGPSANNLTLEVLAPNTTSNGSTTIWKDAVTAYSNDNSVGCFAGTYGATIPTNWGCSLGAKNTSTSGNVIVVKITASAAWTGRIDNITLTWI